MTEKYYAIGEVSKLTGATIKTIRYYDDINLLPASHVSSVGYRYYDQEDIWQLELILFLRYLGFKVNDIKQMLHNEIPVSSSIKWQIDAIQHQLDHLGKIKDILHQASKQDNPETQLNYLHDVAEIINKSTKQRQDFIAAKMHDAFIEPELPEDWNEQMLTSYIGFVPEQQILTESQLAAWTKMKAMLSDATFAQEIKGMLGTFWQAVREQHIEASPWQLKYTQITETVIALMNDGKIESSLHMQLAALDYVSLFQQDGTQLGLKELQVFIQHSNAMSSDRLIEWWDLLLILNPSLAPYANSQKMIKQTIQWLIDNPDQIPFRGDD
ncbi:MerR family transcriptional regulator [Paenibacillus sp. KN14-4R]|uniref:MerR family transcriptional regulator n=1 Tax=Paenibacillus sp. KN14-4R TaxID=3445773 RepID=UPI003F9EE352